MKRLWVLLGIGGLTGTWLGYILFSFVGKLPTAYSPIEMGVFIGTASAFIVCLLIFLIWGRKWLKQQKNR